MNSINVFAEVRGKYSKFKNKLPEINKNIRTSSAPKVVTCRNSADSSNDKTIEELKKLLKQERRVKNT